MTEHDWIIKYFEALRAADQRALQIKEEGDSKALNLARQIQTYKDEKANELRSQIESERGTYVTKAELKPFTDYITAQQGSNSGVKAFWGYIVGAVGLAATVVGLILAFNG